MNNATIEDIVIEHTKLWNGFQPARFALDNINFKTPGDGMWYELIIQNGINLMVGMSDKPCVRELGAVVFEVHYPKNENTRSAKRLADSLGNHFQYHRQGKLEFLTASVINIPERKDGYRFDVRIPYRYN